METQRGTSHLREMLVFTYILTISRTKPPLIYRSSVPAPDIFILTCSAPGFLVVDFCPELSLEFVEDLQVVDDQAIDDDLEHNGVEVV